VPVGCELMLFALITPAEVVELIRSLPDKQSRKVFQIGTVRYNWPMSAHASQAFSIAHCTDSEDLPQSLSDTSPTSLGREFSTSGQ